MANDWKHHPAADTFPMLNEKELDELAADIKIEVFSTRSYYLAKTMRSSYLTAETD